MDRHSTDYQDFERLKIFRQSLGLSQGEFADQLKIAQPTYSNYERGKVAIAFSLCKKLLKLFRLNLNWLAEGIGTMKVSEAEFLAAISGGKTSVIEAESGIPILSSGEGTEVDKILENSDLVRGLRKRVEEMEWKMKILEDQTTNQKELLSFYRSENKKDSD
ncbi:MAG: helix-turn-helix transcriptional regulator [Bacteroidota bacterium]